MTYFMIVSVYYAALVFAVRFLMKYEAADNEERNNKD